MNFPWKQKIALIWLGQSLSLLSSSILQMCLIWYLSWETGSATIVTWATLCGYLPQALLGPFVGAIVDRFPKKWVIIGADILIACSSLVLASSFLQGPPEIWMILATLVVRSMGTAFHEPTVHSLTPLIVPKDSLTRYAGFFQAFESISLILCPSLSVLAYQAWPMASIMLLDVGGALTAVTLLLVVAIPKEPPHKQEGKKIRIIQETREGLAIMGNIPGIFPLMFIGFLYTSLYSPVGSLYPLITMNYFQGTTAHSAFVEIVFSCGTLLGALLLGHWGDRFPKHRGLFGSILVYGTGAFLVGFLLPAHFLPFVLISFFMGMSTPFYHGITRAIYQQKVPQEYLGRSLALAQSTRRLGMPLGLLLGGPLADALGVQVLYSLAGGMAILLALVGSRLPGIKACSS